MYINHILQTYIILNVYPEHFQGYLVMYVSICELLTLIEYSVSWQYLVLYMYCLNFR